MFNDELVIDVHGHMSTPPQFRAFAYNLIALRTADSKFTLTPEQMQGPLDRHLRLLDTHNIDVQMISPRPVAMMHWEQAYLVKAWTKTTNDIIAAQCEMYPKRFVGVAQLNQSADLDTSNCIEELERTVGALGFVGALVNPDPGADRRTPGMNDKYWFPLYKKAEELNATLIVHPSITRDPRLEIVPHSYQYNNLTEETLATLLLEHSDVFDTFPKLRIVICHCGGALRRVLEKGLPADAVAHAHGKPNIAGDSGEMAGGSAVNAGMVREKKQRNTWADNLFFDTCSYDGQLLSGALKQRGVAQMVFGTEVPGSGSDLINPLTGAPSDDVLALLRSFDFLDDADIKAIVHDNPLRIFPLLQPKIAKLFATASK